MVTVEERRLANVMDREVSVPLRAGMLAAARLATRILRDVNRAFRARLPITIDFEEVAKLLRDVMVEAYLLGLRRARIVAPTPLAFQRETLAFLQKRLDMSADQLANVAEFYETQALTVARGAARNVEKALQKTMFEATRDGVHVREGMQRLSETMVKQGVTPSSPYMLESMFRTQTQLAYSAGMWSQEQDPDIQEILWGHKYVTVGDTRVRDSHVGLDGVTLEKDDVWWATNRPPNGVNCRCQVIAIYEKREPTKPPHQIEIDGRKVVQGADTGFRFNPGTVFDPLQKITYQGWLEKNAAGQGTMKLKGVLKPKEFWQDKLTAYHEKSPGKTIIPQPKIAPKPAPSLVEKKISTSPNAWKSTESLDEATKQLNGILNLKNDSVGVGYDTAIAKKKLLEVYNAVGDDVTRLRKSFPNIGKAIDQQTLRDITFWEDKWVSRRVGVAGTYDPAARTINVATRGYNVSHKSLSLGEFTVGEGVQSNFVHELGHSVELRLGKGWSKVWDSQSRAYWSKKVSEYGATNARELWAESFSAYTHPRYGLAGKRLPKVIEEFMERAVGKHPNLRVAPEVKKLVGVKPKFVEPPKLPPKRTTFKELTSEEKKAFDTAFSSWNEGLSFLERDTLSEYASSVIEARKIRALQGGHAASKITKENLDVMNQALSRATPFKGTVYRGMNNLDPSFVKKLAVEGNVITLDSFATATTEQITAVAYGSKEKILESGRQWIDFKIKCRSAVKTGAGGRGSFNPTNRLLLKDSRYKITRVTRQVNGVVVEMEEIGTATVKSPLKRVERPLNEWKSGEASSLRFERLSNSEVSFSGHRPLEIRQLEADVINALGANLGNVKTKFPKIAEIINKGHSSLDGKFIRTTLEASDGISILGRGNQVAVWDPKLRSIRVGWRNQEVTAFGRPKIGAWSIGDDVGTAYNHELGHALREKIGQGWDKVWDSQSKEYWAKVVSKQGSASANELFAESFSAYVHPRYAINGKRLPKIIEDFMEKAVGKHPNRTLPTRMPVKSPKLPPKRTEFEVRSKETQFAFNKKVRSWERSLVEDERTAITQYTRTLEGTKDIRDIQRGLTTGETSVRAKVIALEKAFLKAPKFEGTVYRGMRNLRRDFAEKIATEGNVIEFDAFTSTTFKKARAEVFGRNFDPKGEIVDTWIEMKMKTKTGGRISSRLTAVSIDEGEILIPKGTKYRVTRVKEVINDRGIPGFEVEMEQVIAETSVRLSLWPVKRSRIGSLIRQV